MTRLYVPWPERSSMPWRGSAALVAELARRVHAVATPILRRCAGIVFIAVVASIALASAVSFETVTSPLLRNLLGIAGIVGFASVFVAFGIWWERKVAAFVQSRLGPMRCGGWHGWSQSVADGIKLVSKEDSIPAHADRALFRFAPYLSFVPVLAAFVVLPFGAGWVFRQIDVALLFVLAMLGIDVLGVLLAGWAANNKWSVYGALREACQLVSYEIPMGMALLVPVMIVGSLDLEAIAAAQAGGWTQWLAFHSPCAMLAMLIYFVASLAACKRAPFDLPEAESELVAGYHTEYSGFRFMLFFFGEYNAMFIVSALLALMFLGGWDAPWAGMERTLGDAIGSAWLANLGSSTSLPDRLLAAALLGGPIWFIAKCLGIVFVQMWLRWTLPRLRIDQVLYSCVQVFLPMAMVVLLANAAWELAVERSIAFAAFADAVSLLLAIVGFLAAAAVALTARGGARRASQLVGNLANLHRLRGS